MPHVVVVGGGGTGGAVAHDLTLRGLRVTVLERGEVTSGTTGRHHGLLHSGARYAVADAKSAVECVEENRILRRIAPGSFEENDGLFVALDEEDLAYLPGFVEACQASGIPAQVLDAAEALRREPGLSPDVRAAVQVPDGTMDAMRLPLRFFATAQRHGAVIRTFTQAVGLRRENGAVTGVAYRDDVTGEEGEIAADLVVNAAGPWAQRIAEMAGVEVPIRCSPGVLVAVRGRWCNMVVNRLHRSGDGDIVVPQRGLSVIGTSSWVVEDPDDLHLPEDHIRTMIDEGSKLVPAVAHAELRAAWSAVRPLIGDGGSETGRELSRTFKCFDHAERDGVDGFVTISGGKATTLRAMAEATADLVCRQLGVDAPCRTREHVLVPHTAYYTSYEVTARTDGARANETRGTGAHSAVPRIAETAGAPPGTSPVAAAAPTAATTEGPSRVLRVRRWKPGWPAAAAVDYVVPVEPRTTVLDALRSIRWHGDPSLTLRHSCCHSSCGTCGVRVNGAEVLGCVTTLADLPAGVVTVEPMANAPVLSDLVVDMTTLYDGLEHSARPLIRSVEIAVPAARPGTQPASVRLEDCVECGLCVSACPITGTDQAYLGPAVLGAAARVVAEPRGQDVRSVLAWVDDHDGCWRCHLSFACSEVCPTGADPAAGIMALRGALTREHLGWRRAGRRSDPHVSGEERTVAR